MGAEQGFDNAVALAECIDDTETIDEHGVNTLLQKYPNGVPNGITAIELKGSVDEAGDFDVMMPNALIFMIESQDIPVVKSAIADSLSTVLAVENKDDIARFRQRFLSKPQVARSVVMDISHAKFNVNQDVINWRCRKTLQLAVDTSPNSLLSDTDVPVTLSFNVIGGDVPSYRLIEVTMGLAELISIVY